MYILGLIIVAFCPQYYNEFLLQVNHMLNGKRVKKYKTVVQMANLNPYWNTSFKIPVNPVDIQNIELQVGYKNLYFKHLATIYEINFLDFC